MKKESKKFFREVKKQTDKTVEDIKNYASDTKEMVVIYQAYKKTATKFKKVTSDLINLELPIYGIIDESNQTLKFRSKDILEENQVLQSGGNTYKVEKINDDMIEVPVMIKNVQYMVECKVANIKKI